MVQKQHKPTTQSANTNPKQEKVEISRQIAKRCSLTCGNTGQEPRNLTQTTISHSHVIPVLSKCTSSRFLDAVSRFHHFNGQRSISIRRKRERETRKERGIGHEITYRYRREGAYRLLLSGEGELKNRVTMNVHVYAPPPPAQEKRRAEAEREPEETNM